MRCQNAPAGRNFLTCPKKRHFLKHPVLWQIKEKGNHNPKIRTPPLGFEPKSQGLSAAMPFKGKMNHNWHFSFFPGFFFSCKRKEKSCAGTSHSILAILWGPSRSNKGQLINTVAIRQKGAKSGLAKAFKHLEFLFSLWTATRLLQLCLS